MFSGFFLWFFFVCDFGQSKKLNFIFVFILPFKLDLGMVFHSLSCIKTWAVPSDFSAHLKAKSVVVFKGQSTGHFRNFRCLM